ncbi:hypothetical protein M408DRAFT_101699 [Serendipita vermifera MAFF 305830]|uniref:Uncharacterized protein n=1 Tax=Serendipita vermifera MAFF 305830 TaxID=933852 RepID=A0A0C3ANQ3_SERVB|nr:hypothetical protein M408DRAFT_101699 [Serendipita vermifera MAFF 305830]
MGIIACLLFAVPHSLGPQSLIASQHLYKRAEPVITCSPPTYCRIRPAFGVCSNQVPLSKLR